MEIHSREEVEAALAEFLTSLDADEAALRLQSLPASASPILVRRAAELAMMRRGGEAGEALASLVVVLALHGKFGSSAIEEGILTAAARLEDYVLDCPSAPATLVDLAAHLCIAGVASEERLFGGAPGYESAVAACAASLGADAELAARRSLELFARLLALQLGAARAHLSPLAQLRRAYGAILERYVEAGGAGIDFLGEELGCMQARHTTFELVRKAAILACSSSADPMKQEVCSDLVAALVRDGYLSARSASAGLLAALREAGELRLDAPDATRALGRFVSRAVSDGAIDADFVANARRVVGSSDSATLAALDEAAKAPMPWGPTPVVISELRQEATAAGSELVAELLIASLRAPLTPSASPRLGAEPSSSSVVPPLTLDTRLTGLALERDGAVRESVESAFCARVRKIHPALRNEAVRALIEGAVRLAMTAAGGGMSLGGRVGAVLATVAQDGSLAEEALSLGISRAVEGLAQSFEGAQGSDGKTAAASFVSAIVEQLVRTGALGRDKAGLVEGLRSEALA